MNRQLRFSLPISTNYVIAFLSGILQLIVLISLIAAIPTHADDTANIIKLSPEQLQSLGVELGKPTPVEQIPVLYAPAKIVIPPENEYLVSAAQAGLITQLSAAIGDRVKKGDILARLNSPDLLSMQRLYLKAESELDLGTLLYRRDKMLMEDGVIAKRRWQETRSQYQAYASEANEHRQLLEIAGMTGQEIELLKRSHRLTSELNVHSPINGIVLERMAVAGSRVDQLAPLYRIANLNELWLEINIPQERINDVQIGDQVELESKEDVLKTTATLKLLGAAVNQENQTVLARAVINGKHISLRPGQRLNTRIIHRSDIHSGYKVPNAAIAQQTGNSYLFVRTADGFIARKVDIMGKEGNETVVGDSVNGEDNIAVKGTVALKGVWLGLGSDE